MEVSAIVFAIISAIVAHARGRSAIGWFVVGLLLNCFALILLIVLPDLKVEEEENLRRSKLRGEVRRLREQLTQERARNDERFRETSMRLDSHDGHLGIDTRPPPLVPDAPMAAIMASDHPYARVEWFWARPDASTHEEPVSLAGLAELWRDGIIGDRTLVWSEQLPAWTELDQVIGLRDLFDA